MSKNISKNYFYNLLYEALTVLVPLVTTPHVSKVLGAEGIGIYSYTNSIVTYFALFAALGTTVYARREVACSQHDKHGASVVFWEIFLLRGLLAALCMAVYMVYAVNSEYSAIAWIQIFYIVGVVFDVGWFFQGMEAFGKVVLRNSAVKIGNIFFIFAFVRGPADLNMYILGLAVLPVAGSILSLGYLKDMIEGVKPAELHPLRHLKASAAFFIPTIASQVYLVLDKTMLGMIAETTAESGCYEQAQKVIRICCAAVTAYATVLSPRLASCFARKQREKLRKYVADAFNMIWMIASPIAFGLCAVAGILVPWFFGAGFEKVEILLKMFAWIVFPIGLSSVMGHYLIAIQETKVYTSSIIAAAVLNFSVNLLLIPRLYSVGAAAASMMAESVIFLIEAVYLTRGIRCLRFRDILGNCRNYLLAGLGMYLVVGVLARMVPPTFLCTVLLILIGAAVYCAALLAMRDPLAAGFARNLLKKCAIGKRIG